MGAFRRELFLDRRAVVTLFFQVRLKVPARHLDGAPEFHAGYLAALYLLVDPTLAHPEFLADLRDRQQVEPLVGLEALLLLPF